MEWVTCSRSTTSMRWRFSVAYGSAATGGSHGRRRANSLRERALKRFPHRSTWDASTNCCLVQSLWTLCANWAMGVLSRLLSVDGDAVRLRAPTVSTPSAPQLWAARSSLVAGGGLSVSAGFKRIRHYGLLRRPPRQSAWRPPASCCNCQPRARRLAGLRGGTSVHAPCPCRGHRDRLLHPLQARTRATRAGSNPLIAACCRRPRRRVAVAEQCWTAGRFLVRR